MEFSEFEETQAQLQRQQVAGSGERDTTHLRRSPKTQWDQVVNVLNAHYYEPDIEAARVLYAAIAAHDLKGQPVWPMAVAPPGSMKSELVTALDGMPLVHLIDNVTSKTFISGQIAEGVQTRPASLLHRIGTSGIIVCPDFSTILAMKGDERNAVLADLRKIYDGKLTKEFGTTDIVPPWEGRITLVAAVTPAIDKHLSVMQNLGERFVLVRWHRAGPEAALWAIRQDSKTARAELKAAVHALLGSSRSGDVDISDAIEHQLVDLAEFVVRGRTHVDRDGDKAVTADPEPESPTRLAQQLAQLAKGSARLSGRGAVSADDFKIAKRAALDCIPPLRRAVLQGLRTGDQVEGAAATRHYVTQDLQLLGLVDRDAKGTKLSALAERLLNAIEPEASEGFTQDPPHANEGIGIRGRGTSGESGERGRADV